MAEGWERQTDRSFKAEMIGKAGAEGSCPGFRKPVRGCVSGAHCQVQSVGQLLLILDCTWIFPNG